MGTTGQDQLFLRGVLVGEVADIVEAEQADTGSRSILLFASGSF